MRADQLLALATKTLRNAGVDDPARDARILLAFALKIDRSRVSLVLRDDVSPSDQEAYERAIEARAIRQPVAQITGQRAFYGLEFSVTRDVLDPRPDTELLVETALQVPFDSVLDLGTGSGCILLSLLAQRQNARGVGVDLSEAALDVAKQNAENLMLIDRSSFRLGSWFTPVSGAKFDLIVSNPPYISESELGSLSPELRQWEPQMALTPGGDGLAAYREIIASAPDFLNPSGQLIVEIGYQQARAVCDLLTQAGFSQPKVFRDLNQKDRVVSAELTDKYPKRPT